MKNNYDIFKLLDVNNNTKLLGLSNNSLIQIIKCIDKYYLELRDNITKSSLETVGFEFEFEDADKRIISEDMIKRNFDIKEYKIYEDDSIPDGYEICTPILNISNINWNRIKELCYIIRKNGFIGNNCGSHIHFGAHVLNNSKSSITNFVTMVVAYENVIARFLYGNFINERLSMHTYAPPVANKWCDIYQLFESDEFKKISIRDLINMLSGYYEKNQFINLSNVYHLGKFAVNNTIEFRSPNGTLDPIIWQNNCNMILKLMKYCNSYNFDLEIVEDRITKNIMKLGDYKYYRSINIEEAMEFCDLIFDNNIDKIYFLRQYLKDKKYTDNKVLVLSKKFTETPYSDS